MAKKTQDPGELAAELAKEQLKAYSKRVSAKDDAVRDAIRTAKADHQRSFDAKDWRGAAEAHDRHNRLASANRSAGRHS